MTARSATLGAAWAVVLAVLAALLFPPAFLNFDAMYALLWGDDLASGRLPDFTVRGAPTPHPLSNLLGAVLAPLGQAGGPALMGITYLCFGVTVVLAYSIGRRIYDVAAGILAAAIVASREVLLYHTALGYLDIRFSALLLGALALELARPRRGVGVAVLLLLAGLLRPEAWPLAILYALYRWRDEERVRRVVIGGLAVAAPLLWAACDLVVTGDPFFSFTYTRSYADELDRKTGVGHLLVEGPRTYGGALGGLLALTAAIGFVLALRRGGRPRRFAIVLVIVVVALALPAAAGTSILARYFLPAIVLLAVLAAAALGVPFRRPDRDRRRWRVARVAAVVVLAGALVVEVRGVLDARDDLARAHDLQQSLRSLVRDPELPPCAPVTVASYTLVPLVAFWGERPYRDVREWRAARPADGVFVWGTGEARRRFIRPDAPASAPRGFAPLRGADGWAVAQSGCATPPKARRRGQR